MRVLVTGGAGYVGSHAARWLDRCGHEVWVLDNLSRGHRGAALAGKLIEGDIANDALVTEVLRTRKIEAVLHFAAFALVGESVENPALYYQQNVVSTFRLLESMRAAGVKKFVFSSTTATYGAPTIVPIPETTPQHPINPYGTTKLMIEHMLADYAQAYEFSYAALRYFNASGAAEDGTIGEDHTPETHLIPIVLQVALGQRSHVTIFGDDYPTPDGTCIRDYIHVDDLASAHELALHKLAPGHNLQLNLGTGLGFSVREVIDACRRVTGHAIPCEMGQRRAGDPPRLIAASGLAQQTLAWQPQYTSLDAIVETAWRWHSSHPHGYGKG